MFSEVFVTHKKFDIKAHSPFFYYRSPILLYHKKTKTATLFYQNCGFCLAELLASFAERFIAQEVVLLALLRLEDKAAMKGSGNGSALR